MKSTELDDNVKNILLRYIDDRFTESKSSKIVYDINDISNNDPIVKSILNLAIWQFMESGLYVHRDQGEIIFEKYDKKDKPKNIIQKIQCDNDLYYFQKNHTCMFILQCDNENNFFNIYPKYENERVRFPLLPLLCGIELNETVEQILVKESTIYIFKGNLYYQDLCKKDNLVRIIVRMESV